MGQTFGAHRPTWSRHVSEETSTGAPFLPSGKFPSSSLRSLSLSLMVGGAPVRATGVDDILVSIAPAALEPVGAGGAEPRPLPSADVGGKPPDPLPTGLCSIGKKKKRRAADALTHCLLSIAIKLCHPLNSSSCPLVGAIADLRTLFTAARSGELRSTHNVEAGGLSTGESSSSRAELTSFGFSQPMEWPSMTRKSGCGPQRVQTADSAGKTKERRIAVLNFTTSWRRRRKESRSDDKWRISAVYVL